MNSRSITVAEHAKQDFSMGSYHKEVATFLLEGTEDANTTDQILIRVRGLSLCLIRHCDLCGTTASFMSNR